MTIRDAAEADLPAIVAIFNTAVLTRMSTAVLDPVTVEERLLWFHEHSADRHPLWVLQVNDKVAGWLSFHPFVRRAAYRATSEVSVYIAREYQRRGLGRALLGQAITHSPALGLTALLGLILGHNSASLCLFEQLGFERWGLLPEVTRLDGIRRDVVIVGQQIPPAETAPPRSSS